MQQDEATSFIKKAITTSKPERWADLGCGSGTFTRALSSLLPTGSHVTAVDQQQQFLNMAGVKFIRADFENDDYDMTDLDGILLANSIHSVTDKIRLIRKLELMFANAPKFLIIEYDTERSNQWVPYPISFAKLQILFLGLGYHQIDKLNTRSSAYNSGEMYCSIISR